MAQPPVRKSLRERTQTDLFSPSPTKKAPLRKNLLERSQSDLFSPSPTKKASRTPTRSSTRLSSVSVVTKLPTKGIITKKKGISKKLDVTTTESDENENDEVHDEEDDSSRAHRKRACPLPCRESQFTDISSFLESNLKLRNSGCMYVSGVPGTGKTAIVNAVLKNFQQSQLKKKEKDFKIIFINGLTLSAPNRIWKRFYNELNPGQKSKMNPDVARQKLNLYFEKQHAPIILIIDELDQILDKQQAILYRLLDWAAHPSNLFSLICIFNTMHLPESILTMRNASRMGMVRCAFPPYTHEELATIVRRSLGDESSSRLNEALTLLSRKVAAISGDARRALEIAKRTLEIIKTNDEGGNTSSAVVAVSEAFKELFSSPKTEAVKQCTEMEQIVLRSIISDLQTSGSEETKVTNIMDGAIGMARCEGRTLSVDQVFHILKNLHGSKIILMEHNTTSLYNKVSLNISIPDVQYGLGAANRD